MVFKDLLNESTEDFINKRKLKRRDAYKKFANIKEDKDIDMSNLNKEALKRASMDMVCSEDDIKEALEEDFILKEDTLGDVIKAAKEKGLDPEIATDKSEIELVLDRALVVAKRNQRHKSKDYPNILLMGEAGSAKTGIVTAWAKKHGLNLMVKTLSSMDPTDFEGNIVPDTDNTGVAKKLASTEFDQLEKPNSVLFLDELNRSSMAVATNVMELVNNHILTDPRVEGGKRFLPNFLFTVAAINPPNNNYDVRDLDFAEVTRYQLVIVNFDPKIQKQFLNTEYNRYLQELDPEEDPDEELELKRKIAIVNKLLGDKRFTYDNSDDIKEGIAKYGRAYFRPLNYRTFSSLINVSDGTKEDILRLWDRYANPGKKFIIEDILSDYEDVDDKANQALAGGTESELLKKDENVFSKEKSSGQKIRDLLAKYGK